MTTNIWRYARRGLLAGVLACAFNPPSLAGEDLQSLAGISATAAEAAIDFAASHGYSDVDVSTRPLDDRLKLPMCDNVPRAFINPSAKPVGPISIGVRCEGSDPWTIYVRADVSATVTLPVLVRSLPRGSVISENDLEMVTRPITNEAQAVIADPARAIGLETKRAMAAGSTLTFSQLAAPELVTRGQRVTLIAGGQGLEVRMEGKAMGNAAAGERLLVTNTASGRKIEGVVQSDGSVLIP